MATDDSTTVTLGEQMEAQYGGYYDTEVPDNVVTWTSSDSGVATGTSLTDQINSGDDGTADLHGTWGVMEYDEQANEDGTGNCDPQSDTAAADEQVTVQSCPGDSVRSAIKKEYKDHPEIGLTPDCADFTTSKGSANFSFGQLNTGDYSVALIKDPLISAGPYSSYGLEAWRNAYGFPMIVNSAYRNPIRNINVGGAGDSRHLYGDAADIRTNNDHDVWTQLALAAQNAYPDWIEDHNGACAWVCVHADWRYEGTGTYR